MPYINIKVTKEGGASGSGPSEDQKRLLIEGVTDLLQRVLGKDPATTFVVIDEVPLTAWGVAGRSVHDIRGER
jgi:4-oxalocrotonate tautomerase